MSNFTLAAAFIYLYENSPLGLNEAFTETALAEANAIITASLVPTYFTHLTPADLEVLAETPFWEGITPADLAEVVSEYR